MEQDNFQKNLLKHTEDFRKVLATPSGDWSVKGFIDIAKNIYTISVDTKIVSKIIELMMFPVIQKFAKENGYEMIFSAEQNHYPDVTFVTKDKKKIALTEKITRQFPVLRSAHLPDIFATGIQRKISPFHTKNTTSIIFSALSILNRRS